MGELVSGSVASFIVASKLSDCVAGPTGEGGFGAASSSPTQPTNEFVCCVYLLLCVLLGDSSGLGPFCAAPFCSFLSLGIAGHAFLTGQQKRTAMSSAVAAAICKGLSWTAASTSKSFPSSSALSFWALANLVWPDRLVPLVEFLVAGSP